MLISSDPGVRHDVVVADAVRQVVCGATVVGDDHRRVLAALAYLRAGSG